MKKKQKLFLGLPLVIMVILTMTGCATLFAPPPEFPSDFIGTWERVDQSAYTYTITFTSKTVKSNNRNYYWELQSISGDVYSIKNSSSTDSGKITFKLRDDGNLYIKEREEDYASSSWQGTEADWTGIWKRK